MLKNIAWDTKDKKSAAIIFAVIISGQLFFEVMRVGYNSITEILLVALAAISFSLFFITTIEGKWNRIFSAQGIAAALTVVSALGLANSFEVGNSTFEGVYTMLAASVMLLLVQKIYFLPVVAIIGFVMSLLTEQPLIQSITIFALPASIGLSCVYYSGELKDFAVWKKIIFIVSQIVMLAAFGYTIFCRRYTITFHSFITEAWDSLFSMIAVIILICFAVKTIIKKECIIRAFGYLLPALLSMVPMFMEKKYALISAMTLFMFILFASKEGSVADEIFDNIVYRLKPKNKKK